MENKLNPIVEIDSLTAVCGFFNGKTNVNNGYGCEHSDCEEKELVHVLSDGTHERCEKKLERQIFLIALRKKYGSWKNIENASKTEDGEAYIRDIKNNKLYENSFVEQFNCKWQGKCYSFSCPLANECDLQDLKENDTEMYNEWKDGDYEPNEAGAQLMLITDEKLIKAML